MPDSETLSGGPYEVLRSRLETLRDGLEKKLEQLNQDRQEVFGAVETSLEATARISTEHACTPRDLRSIGANLFLFGYNVQIGLKNVTVPSDVLALHHYDPETQSFTERPLDEALSKEFHDDFAYLYKYYRAASFLQLHRQGTNLFLIFQAGRDATDFKAFKFLCPGDGTLTYLGNRFDHEITRPPQHPFPWKRASREAHRGGEHPHISIEDLVFVETLGGDLTIKIEDNTRTGQGIYSEPVDHVDQTLDDAEIHYAVVGSLVILKIRPYQEKQERLLVYNTKLHTVQRIDAILRAAVLLPEDHGLVFPGGYVLQTGEVKLFPGDFSDLRYYAHFQAPNGEDHLYVFRHEERGEFLLMPYNLISQTLDTPIPCGGFALFPGGQLITFKAESEPQKHHALQIWKTPFATGSDPVGGVKAGLTPAQEFLHKLGNPEIVRALADAREIARLLRREDLYADLYLDLTRRCGATVDRYFWLGKPEAHDLAEPLRMIRETSQAAIEEFEKVRRQREDARKRTADLEETIRKTLLEVESTPPDSVPAFVDRLATVRTLRGQVLGLRDIRYTDAEAIAALDEKLSASVLALGERCVVFLLEDSALLPYRERLTAAKETKVTKTAEAAVVDEEFTKLAADLELLMETVGNLQIADPTQTTRIISDLSALFSELNAARAALQQQVRTLGRGEDEAGFQAQLRLLSQAVTSSIDRLDTPEKAAESLSRIMVRLEELEGKYSAHEDFLEQLTTRREEIYEAFESRRIALLEARQKRADGLARSASRLLITLEQRLKRFEKPDEILGYLASDAMAEKLRSIIADLRDLGDPVKADDLNTRLRTAGEEALRQLRDREELYSDGGKTIALGDKHFSVADNDLELTLLPREEELALHLTGTRYFETVTDPEMLSLREVWSLESESEGPDVARAEYLAWKFLPTAQAMARSGGETDPQERFAALQQFAASRYSENYTKGVHDHDAELLVEALLPLSLSMGSLRRSPAARAVGRWFWSHLEDPEVISALKISIAARFRAESTFVSQPGTESERSDSAAQPTLDWVRGELEKSPVLRFLPPAFSRERVVSEALDYLRDEMSAAADFAVSRDSAKRLRAFHEAMPRTLIEERDRLSDPAARIRFCLDWLQAWSRSSIEQTPPNAAELLEDAVLLTGLGAEFSLPPVRETGESPSEISGLLSTHARIQQGVIPFSWHDFTQRLSLHQERILPAFRKFQERKLHLLHETRRQLRLDDLKPRVLSSFVRNRLIDEVYLPMIGGNFAKQIGTAGPQTRTDRSGLLLLISPPGYGKTTLIEYIASRLGMVLVKINAPALGHGTTTLDPADAPDSAARQEVERLNLAFEMGDNVLLYLDDIQHTNPEFLQKFISLCDATRRIEGVWKGVNKTWDLRGRRFAVVMAGNPYTEGGQLFKIPDMLSNRADTFNLGDILGGHQSAFEDSYLENALTSSATLRPLAAAGNHADIQIFISMARDAMAQIRSSKSGAREFPVDFPPPEQDFKGNYNPEEIRSIAAVTARLLRVRDTLLRVNQEYIRSAGQSAENRVEPPFKLQGSYRNMARLTEKVESLMTLEEIERLIADHYRAESQTLTTNSEANLVKLKELESSLTAEEAARWAEIKAGFQRQQIMGGAGDDSPASRVVGQLALLHSALESLRTASATATLSEATLGHLERIISSLRAVPVQVDISVQPVEEAASPTDSLPAPEEGAGKSKGKATRKPPTLNTRSDVRQGDAPDPAT